MPLSPEERQRIYEEEAARRQVPLQYTPTDWLASCILGPLIITGIIVVIIIVVIFLAAASGLFRF